MDAFKTAEHTVNEMTSIIDNLGFNSDDFDNDTTTSRCECGETTAIIMYSDEPNTPFLKAMYCSCCGDDDNFSDEVVSIKY